MSYDLRVTSQKKKAVRASHRREFNGVMGGCMAFVDLATGSLRLIVDTPAREYELEFSREASEFIRERLVTRTCGTMARR